MRIDPATGLVLERIDAGGLLSESEAAGADVLNGIAYDPADGLFYITGKRWPKLFKVRFVPASARDYAPVTRRCVTNSRIAASTLRRA